MLTRAALGLIAWYQKTLSPDHGLRREAYPFGYCRFKPTCSQYTYEAIERYGLWRGAAMGLWRIIKCNPFSKGGYDPIK